MTSRREKSGIFGRGPRAGEIALAALAIAVVVVLVVPIPQALLDLLIAVNLGLSMTLFAAALFVKRPLELASFPTLLLIATLYRLALNVSSVRLILRDADAGRIIGAFGSFAVGGDILIGAVVFSILAIVLFLVITKGAERVAEVAARFSLDSLPGMQLAIETDLKSGAISARELSRRRMELERKSHYYGALDGAMKFVRGDAVANLAIIFVNLAGGAAVGTLRHGMSIGAALDTYGRLSIGDGLVTLLPAVLVSTAAGLLVTRLGQGDDGGLGEALWSELGEEPRPLFVASAAMFALAALPGFPLWPFAGVGLALATPGAIGLHRTRARRAARERLESPRGESSPSGPIDLDRTQELVDMLAISKPVLVRETVPRLVSLPALTEILALLREDDFDETHLTQLLESLARDGGKGGPFEIAERARRRMSQAITARLVGAAGGIELASLERDLESVLEGALVKTVDGDRLAMSEADLRPVIAACQKVLSAMERPALLVSPRLRRPLRRALCAGRVSAIVVTHGELDGDAEVRIARRISL